MALGELQFAAFLSYSRHDKRLALWLVRALEEFTPPHRTVVDLKARQAKFLAPKPVFRDENDMPVGGAVPDRLNEVLDASASMIVLCTPASAKSAWVNEEVKLFARRHPDRPIIAAVAEGDPDCMDCYPPALFARGKPLAAELRIPAQRRQSIIKITAAILHLDVDELVGRVQKRKARRLMLLAAGSALAAGIVISLSTLASVMSDRATKADELARADIERTLTETRKAAEAGGTLSVKAAVNAQAKAYFDRKAGRLSSKDLFLKAEWLRQEGIDADARGEAEQSLAHHKDSYAATRELLKREAENPDYLFSNSQSAFWVGNYHYQRGDAEAAQPPFQDYLTSAKKLLAVAPDRLGAAEEVYYATVNLAALTFARDRDSRAAARSFKAAIDVLDARELGIDARANLSKTYIQYIEALAMYAPAEDVRAATLEWQPLLLELEAAHDKRLEVHLANAWDKIVAVKLSSGAIVTDVERQRLRPQLDDPDNVTAAEIKLRIEEAPDCGALPEASALDVGDRPQSSLLYVCMARLPASEMVELCSAYAAALPPQPDHIDNEDVWASVLGECGRSALRSRDALLSSALESAVSQKFFARNPEQMRLWTQLAISRFPMRERSQWIKDLKASLDERGWKPTGGK